MIIALVIWTGLIAGLYLFSGLVLGILTPSAAWLQANPDIAGWITPALGFVAALGPIAAGAIWLAGAALIAWLGWPAPGRRRGKALSYEEWQLLDGGAAEAGGRPYRRDRFADDPPRFRRRRRRRDDDDDDDDDDD